MWSTIRDQYVEPLLGIFYPHLCLGCNAEVIQQKQFLCASCLTALPYTGFEKIIDNPVERIFWGRVDLNFACSTFYFIDGTPLQHLIHEVKYKENKNLGIAMGKWMGEALKMKLEKDQIDLMIPMPLHPKKEKARGYNQASLLCMGMKEMTGIAFDDRILLRTENTVTQTHKSRIERWQNVASVFKVADPLSVSNKHLLLVDDVITTGASTEACALALLKAGARSVSIHSLAFTL